tara:strand:+ start:188 stop:328 length:141 start_codon:yes stop_codon:yes gene_type:complete
MRPKAFNTKKLGKIILIISIFFVFLFLSMLIFKWFKNPEMFLPVFG